MYRLGLGELKPRELVCRAEIKPHELIPDEKLEQAAVPQLEFVGGLAAQELLRQEAMNGKSKEDMKAMSAQGLDLAISDCQCAALRWPRATP